MRSSKNLIVLSLPTWILLSNFINLKAMYLQDISIYEIWEMESISEKVNIFHGDRSFEIIDLKNKTQLYFRGPGSDQQPISYKIVDNTIQLFNAEQQPLETLVIKVGTIGNGKLTLTFCYREPKRKGRLVEMFDATYRLKSM